MDKASMKPLKAVIPVFSLSPLLSHLALGFSGGAKTPSHRYINVYVAGT